MTGQIQLLYRELPSEVTEPLFQKSTDLRRQDDRWQRFVSRVRKAAQNVVQLLD